jgi:hypothetical protein
LIRGVVRLDRADAGRRAGVCGAGVVEVFVFCAEAETVNDRASAATMNDFLNMMTPLVKLSDVKLSEGVRPAGSRRARGFGVGR